MCIRDSNGVIQCFNASTLESLWVYSCLLYTSSSLIYPLFVKEGTGIKEEIPSMPNQYRYSLDVLPEKLAELADAGVTSVMPVSYTHLDVYKRQVYSHEARFRL